MSANAVDRGAEGLQRLLSSPSSFDDSKSSTSQINPYTSTGFVVWYAFVVLCCILPTCCFCFIYLRKSHLRDEEDSVDGIMERWERRHLENEISRIEANVTAFCEREQSRRKGALRIVLKDQTVTFTEKESPKVKDDDSASDVSSLNSGCAICLSKYENGDSVVNSSNTKCKHVFHEDCIVQWLVTRRDPLCPCCRQTFVEVDYDNRVASLLASPNQIQHQPMRLEITASTTDATEETDEVETERDNGTGERISELPTELNDSPAEVDSVEPSMIEISDDNSSEAEVDSTTEHQSA